MCPRGIKDLQPLLLVLLWLDLRLEEEVRALALSVIDHLLERSAELILGGAVESGGLKMVQPDLEAGADDILEIDLRFTLQYLLFEGLEEECCRATRSTANAFLHR